MHVKFVVVLSLGCAVSPTQAIVLIDWLQAIFQNNRLGALWCILFGLACETSDTLPTASPMMASTMAPVVAPSNFLTKFGSFEVLETIPHDAGAFTQGLVTVLDNDGSLKMVEGTGIRGDSELRLLDITTGAVLQSTPIANVYFGEGIAHFRDSANDDVTVLQLTWQRQTGFEYNLFDSLDISEASDTFMYSTTTSEGWGLTYGNDALYVTDGSEVLHTWDPVTRTETGTVSVTYQPAPSDSSSTLPSPLPVRNLNELEFDPSSNTVLANIWMTDDIVRIDPATGFCTVRYDLSTLFPRETRPFSANVLNGIALTYDSSIVVNGVVQIPDDTDPSVVWVTGKYWPTMYKIRLIDDVE